MGCSFAHHVLSSKLKVTVWIQPVTHVVYAGYVEVDICQSQRGESPV